MVHFFSCNRCVFGNGFVGKTLKMWAISPVTELTLGPSVHQEHEGSWQWRSLEGMCPGPSSPSRVAGSIVTSWGPCS